MSKIIEVEVTDLRVPTSDTLQGSDPFHKKPNYSCVLTGIRTEDGLVGLSVNFSAGAGNDWLAYGVRDLSKLILGRNLAQFIEDPGDFYRLLVDHHQLRWLADGVARMAVGSILNALWDLWAKAEQNPSGNCWWIFLQKKSSSPSTGVTSVMRSPRRRPSIGL